MPVRCFTTILTLLLSVTVVRADSLHEQIDALVLARAAGRPVAPPADDAEFLRRVYLDFAGHIPPTADLRAFLADKSANRRTQVIDRLLAGPEYPRRMQELFHVMLMERLGDNAEWAEYLHTAFQANRTWDIMAREILAGEPKTEAERGAVFFYAKRLENYGQNPVDYPALTRDVGRLFLGLDLQCAQCHDHRVIKDYKQHDFQGLFAFFQNVGLQDAKKPAIAEKPTTQKLAFQSVFNKVPKETGPRIPGGKELDVPAFRKGDEFVKPPDPKTKSPGVLKFSPLSKLAEQLPTSDNAAFARNMANRLWFMLMGRGLVHPLDLHHSANPPSHAELLDLLAREFVDHKFDMKWLLREIALSATYQRSSVLPAGADKMPPSSFLVAIERRLSAEQLLGSFLEAIGEGSLLQGQSPPEAARAKFVKAFANSARDAEVEPDASLRAALFLLNDDTILGWLAPKPGNLVDRLTRIEQPEQLAAELYLSVLSRAPNVEELAEVKDHLTKYAGSRAKAVSQLVWALLASSEFCVNH
jgi:hypothetical protein